jgi:hypothetical protein
MRIVGLSSKNTTVRGELNLPLAHGEQYEEPGMNVPVPPRQLEQFVLLVAKEYCPLSQRWQRMLPVLLEKRPGVHG